MNTEQILIRMGVDARAVVTGLNSIGNQFQAFGKRIIGFSKGWTAELMHELKGAFGKFLVAGFAIESLNEIKNELVEIKRLSEETGTNTNFIQSLMLESKISGTSIEALTMPLIHLNRIIGDAKQGLPGAVVQLNDMGLAADKSSIRTLTLTKAMFKLKEQFDKLGDAQRQDALLNDAFGRSAFRMSPIFRQNIADFQAMFQDNYLTKITSGAVQDFTDMWAGIKKASQVGTATLVNMIDEPIKGFRYLSRLLGVWSTGTFNSTKVNSIFKQLDEAKEKEDFEKSLANQADQEGITVQEEKVKILNEQNELLEKQAELSSEIADRGKLTIAQMAANARKRLGIREPQNYVVSARDREALRIDTLEKRASIAFERGDDKTFQRLRSEADRARAGFAGATFKDRNPLGRTEVELAKVNAQLEPVKRMANLINDEHTKPK